MDEALRRQWLMAQQAQSSQAASPGGFEDDRVSAAVNRDYAGLRNFIRKRVADARDAEDILQDVFYELVEAFRMMQPIEQVTAWLFRVARNRITDLFRRKQKEERRSMPPTATDDGTTVELDELLPSSDAGPEDAYMRSLISEELDSALDELPEEQREVFVAHELMGYSYNEIAEQTGVSVNTLLSRKHYAVLHLRKRLRAIYDEFLKGE